MVFSPPPRDDVAGIGISLTSYGEVLEAIAQRPADRALTAAFCNVHSVMTARRHDRLRAALAGMDLATPDGMPLVWWLRLRHPEQQRVYGPDLMELALVHGVEQGWRHFFYGSTDTTLTALAAAACRRAPGLQEVGRYSPPFRDLTHQEEDEIASSILASEPDILWVGLGMPRQELWVDRMAHRFPGVAVMAVGAAFDLIGGTVAQAPDAWQRRGLEWAYRLVQEPKRLWRRYLSTNPAFAALLVREWMQTRWLPGGSQEK